MRVRWRFRRNPGEDGGSQLVEFAVTLPLLVVFVVGIFDFSGAFTIKEKLTNAARDAARVAAADPASDIPSSSLPASVTDSYQDIINYFAANQMNNCGMTASSGVLTPPTTWTFSSSGSGCPGAGLTIIINRGYYFPANSASVTPSVTCQPQNPGSQTAVIATCVSIQYAYAWRFGNVASLLGSTVALPRTLSSTAVAMNEN
jgi:Flp pilus assembly protein TadG